MKVLKVCGKNEMILYPCVQMHFLQLLKYHSSPIPVAIAQICTCNMTHRLDQPGGALVLVGFTCGEYM